MFEDCNRKKGDLSPLIEPLWYFRCAERKPLKDEQRGSKKSEHDEGARRFSPVGQGRRDALEAHGYCQHPSDAVTAGAARGVTAHGNWKRVSTGEAPGGRLPWCPGTAGASRLPDIMKAEGCPGRGLLQESPRDDVRLPVSLRVPSEGSGGSKVPRYLTGNVRPFNLAPLGLGQCVGLWLVARFCAVRMPPPQPPSGSEGLSWPSSAVCG